MTEQKANTHVESGYAPVNGLKMYYEIHGSGQPPLVLLHGGLSAIGTSFGKVLPSFARTRQVIGVEQQAHGHTADIERPLSYEQMADDTAALLRHIGVEQADFFGYSVGWRRPPDCHPAPGAGAQAGGGLGHIQQRGIPHRSF